MHEEHLICTLGRLAEAVERVAQLWARDIACRYETHLTQEDHQALSGLVLKAQSNARRMKRLASAFTKLDEATPIQN